MASGSRSRALAALLAVGLQPLAARAALAMPADDQTLLFYNARMAMRQGHPAEVLKLWLLHNTVANHTGEQGAEERAFGSVVWAALGALGLCQDGFSASLDDAGLWPLAFHNWVVHNLAQTPPPDRPAPFAAFDVRRQQRFVSLRDVLNADELRSVTFFRTSCLFASKVLLGFEESPFLDLRDRVRAAKLLRRLLQHSRTTLVKEKVERRAVIEARIFDIDLWLGEMAARAARREAREQARAAKSKGISSAAVQEVTAAARPFAFAPDSEEAAILDKSLRWSAAEWLTLSRERRLFLFSQLRKRGGDSEARTALALSIIDALIARKEGGEIEQWLGFLPTDLADRRVVWAGARGLNLLGLDRDSGFREGAPIALHRGVAFLEEGNLRESLRSFAWALKQAESSREADATTGLSRRWLSYVVGMHETTGELMATLSALVPRQELNSILEDLVWRAAFRADAASFALCTKYVKGRGAFDARLARLRPLATGNAGAFRTSIRDGLVDEPFATLRFVRQFIERLEAEDGEVRRAHAPTIEIIIAMLGRLAAAQAQGGSRGRAATELAARCEAMLDGIDILGRARDATSNARALAPGSEVFAGTVRLAPSDTLPWPFAAPIVSAPSVFDPLELTPVEWRNDGGALVFGWTISE